MCIRDRSGYGWTTLESSVIRVKFSIQVYRAKRGAPTNMYLCIRRGVSSRARPRVHQGTRALLDIGMPQNILSVRMVFADTGSTNTQRFWCNRYYNIQVTDWPIWIWTRTESTYTTVPNAHCNFTPKFGWAHYSLLTKMRIRNIRGAHPSTDWFLSQLSSQCMASPWNWYATGGESFIPASTRAVLPKIRHPLLSDGCEGNELWFITIIQ